MTTKERKEAGSVGETLEPQFGSREERIAYNEAWSRSLNERRAQWAAGHEARPSFRCECWEHGCRERIPLSRGDWEMVRAEPSRFAVAPGHVAENFEAVIKAFPRFWMVEKFGLAGEIAKQLANSDVRLTRSA